MAVAAEAVGVGVGVFAVGVGVLLVNWLKVRTKVSVESLGVRIFTQIFRG